MRRARVVGFCHHVTGLGRETGAGIEAIALQPSEGHRRLPAVGASRTIPRHGGPFRGTQVAGARLPRYAPLPTPCDRGAAGGVRPPRPHRAPPSGRGPDAPPPAAAPPPAPPPAARPPGPRPPHEQPPPP